MCFSSLIVSVSIQSDWCTIFTFFNHIYGLNVISLLWILENIGKIRHATLAPALTSNPANLGSSLWRGKNTKQMREKSAKTFSISPRCFLFSWKIGVLSFCSNFPPVKSFQSHFCPFSTWMLSMVQLCPQIHLLSCEKAQPLLSFKLLATFSWSVLVTLPDAIICSRHLPCCLLPEINPEQAILQHQGLPRSTSSIFSADCSSEVPPVLLQLLFKQRCL